MSGNQHAASSQQRSSATRPASEPVPGPFRPGELHPGGSEELLTPQGTPPIPLHQESAPERAAS